MKFVCEVKRKGERYNVISHSLSLFKSRFAHF